jgi:hypothetical protein
VNNQSFADIIWPCSMPVSHSPMGYDILILLCLWAEMFVYAGKTPLFFLKEGILDEANPEYDASQKLSGGVITQNAENKE